MRLCASHTRRLAGAAAWVAGLLLAGACTSAVRTTVATPVVAYENGHWFNGSVFEARTMYVQGDRLVERPTRADSVVDLAGGYVVAPFGEAHNHNAEPPRWEEQSRRYMDAGVFHVLNPNSLPDARAAISERINRPDAPDVVFAHGGITGPGGHPIGLVQRNIARGVWTAEQGEGAFLFSVANAAELDAAWRTLLASRPDLVKVYLLYSEEYHARLADPATVGWRGMDPALLPDVMSRARSAGLRVAAHVETAEDFRVAADAGVDIIAHMPGFRGDENTALPDASRYRITAAAAASAARNGTTVVTTLAALAEHAAASGDTAFVGSVDRLNRANLDVLQRNGVSIAVGSDAYSGTSVQEALYLATLGVLNHSAVLRAWSETTPRVIHPGRRIGRLEPGHEASFLVLDGDPLVDFSNVTRIRSAVKQGQPTQPTTTAIATATASTTLRVMTYNIFAGNDLERQSNLARIAALIDSLEVDVVLLQEVDRGTARSGRVDQALVIAASAGMHVVFGSSMNFDGGEYGNAILSRWPIQSSRVVPLQREERQSNAAQPGAAQPGAALVNPPQPTEPRSVLHAIVSAPGGALHVLNTHVDHRPESPARKAQLLELLAYVADAVPRDARVIFGGDLNARPETEEVRSLAVVFTDVWSSCGAGDGYTFRSDAPDRRIDYIMLANLECTTARVLDTQLSDHRPVVADIRRW